MSGFENFDRPFYTEFSVIQAINAPDVANTVDCEWVSSQTSCAPSPMIVGQNISVLDIDHLPTHPRLKVAYNPI
jgi:hypothetical protein